ncbi:MAG: hypothetical protein A3G91_01045 [Omnitrophica WOR_2 bacterium RIFCSPLOWO2_12_FULL_50_9]|nr:MAG: hypothetical protein A3G91_01045 [Omnitrophica WOR_2 bacterium RIFCSPLOWO2_12_FULL_50_9]
MKDFLRVFFILLTGFTCFGFSAASFIWQRASDGIYESDVRALAVHPSNESVIYAGTAKALYKSNNRGRDYRSVFQPDGESKEVNFIYVPPDQPQAVYAATDAGLYESLDEGERWRRIYYDSDAEARKCLSVVQDEKHLYAATSRGLRRRDFPGTTWRTLEGELGDRSVYHTVQDKDFIYLATDRRLYRMHKQAERYAAVFSVGIRDIPNGDNTSDETFDSGDNSIIRSLHVAPNGRLFLASSKGIYSSADQGQQWQPIAAGPLPLNEITSLVSLEVPSTSHGEHCPAGDIRCVRLLAGTKKGAFVFEDGRWMSLYKGMETNQVNHLIRDAQETVYAATDKGIFYLPDGKALPFSELQGDKGTKTPMKDLEEMDKNFHDEPAIGEVHRWAIDYAEVHPDKIKSWRSLARTRAFLPSLSVGIDRADSEFFHWDTGANPDVLVKGRDLLDWDVALSWDLGDLIWSDDQTGIDTRSKLMVELREDILDQVTRLYFERRRIQMELAMASALEPQIRLDKQMRVEELTALIDAFTGGEFSRLMQENVNPNSHRAQKRRRGNDT